jgi:ribonuclease T2
VWVQPDECNGNFQENCDKSRAYKNITQILKAAGDSSLLSYMQTYWQSNDESAESFWENEWEEHGTVRTLQKESISPSN